MAHSQEDDALAREHLTGSEEQLTAPAAVPRGGSNSRALKIAGLTTLVCLLVSSQLFTAYIVFDQRQQVQSLQKSSDRLSRGLARTSQVKTPMKLQMPMNSLLMDFAPDQDAAPSKPPQPKDTATVSEEKQLMDAMLNLNMFNETLLANMQCLKEQMNETDWKRLEALIRQLLNFQKAHQKSVPPSSKPDFPVIKTKCQIEATTGVGKFGSFKPQCDEQGHYHPMQCWHATGYCWCVDETGAAIKDTMSRQRPECKGLRRAATSDIIID
ncbi:H-2 class II histocompatibility antigen gamma chain [Salarias fasciatus]|uniref:Thyroglobulin type-1 domain-containing protein n=1 Tax=Salarias fasciatus TaxID=181472 RepID=A0A672IML5_SALFA|nr:HLA class II histocompatibility antigen gamma chain [Salarias fasciatus]